MSVVSGVFRGRLFLCVVLGVGFSCAGGWSDEPTYHGQIIRLLQNKCIKCHHDGGIGPTDWSDYGEVLVYKDVISHYVSNGIMPPWNASPEWEQGFESGQGFLPNNELTQEQIDLLADWVAAGAPEGDPADAPPASTFEDEWFQGDPDVVLEMAVEWTHPLPGTATPASDRYRCFPMDATFTGALDNDEIVVGFEVRPSNLNLAHHAVVYIVNTQIALNKQAADQVTPGVDDGWDCFGGSGVGGSVLQGWAPGGNIVPLLNDELGVLLPADQTVVLQMHYNNVNGPAESDRTRIGLKLSSDPNILLVRNTIPTVLPGWNSAAIQGPALNRDGPCTSDLIGPGPCVGPGCGAQLPGETNVYRMTFNIPTDQHLVSVFPHMHLIGSEFVVTATLPDMSVIPIIRLDEWDFDWQLSYNFKQPIALPAGSVITVTGTFFNDTVNPVCGGLFSYESMFTFGNSITQDSDGIPVPRDSTPPRVVSVVADTVESALTLTVTFDEEIAVPHYPSSIEISGASGRVSAPDSITVSGNSLIIEYGIAPEESSIDFELILRGFFGIQDLNGNFLDGNANAVGGEMVDDLIYAFQWSGASLTAPSDGGGGGSSSTCFIATAAYGTPRAAEIDVLRRFRDGYLLDTVTGAAFVDTYYRISPPIAERVSTIPVLGAAVRLMLIPVLLLTKVVMAWPLFGPLFGAVCLGAAALYLRGRRSRLRGKIG